jgi:hypothetical protein
MTLHLGISGYVVRANGDTGLDVVGAGSIADRYGLGWGVYPPTDEGRALAAAAAAEWNSATEALMPGSIGTGPEQIPAAIVLPLLTDDAADEIRELDERGEEHIARERLGDEAVDAWYRAGLEADGWDFEQCLQHANGFGR